MGQESPSQHGQFLECSAVQHASAFFLAPFFAEFCELAATETASVNASTKAKESSLYFFILVLPIKRSLP
jgi:hypothetical protein